MYVLSCHAMPCHAMSCNVMYVCLPVCKYVWALYKIETRTSPALRPRAFSKSEMPTSPDSNESSLRSSFRFLVHGWDWIKNVHFSLLGLSSHKNVKCYPTMTKVYGLGRGLFGLRLGAREG